MLIKELDITPAGQEGAPNYGMDICQNCPLALDPSKCGAVAINTQIADFNKSFGELTNPTRRLRYMAETVGAKMLGEAVMRGVSANGFSHVIDDASKEVVSCEGPRLQYTEEELEKMNAVPGLQDVTNDFVVSNRFNLNSIPGHLSSVQSAAAK